MTTEESDSKNQEIRRHSLQDLKAIMLEMLEMDADQIVWNHVCDLAAAAYAIQSALNGDED